MTNPLEMKMVRVRVICDTLGTARGDADLLPIGKAMMLEAMGAVKIMEDLKKLKHGNNYVNYMEKFKYSNGSGTRVLWVKNRVTNPNHEFAKTGQNCGFNVVGVNTDDPNIEHLLRKAQVVVIDKDVVDFKNEAKVPSIVFEYDIYADVYAFWRKVESLIK
jgi:hypothetical protein